jgi:phosphoglycerate dehydrogenase-like enzyme
MPRVLIFPQLLQVSEAPFLDVLRAAGLEAVFPSDEAAERGGAALADELSRAEAVLAGGEPYTREAIAASKLRVIARVGVGYDAVDVAAATERGIALAITPGTNEISVAEQAFALLFAVCRGSNWREQKMRRGDWNRTPSVRIGGKTIGLVGLGRIGRAMVPRAQGLGLRVIAYDPLADANFARQAGVELRSLDELLAEADIVSLHCPASPETRHLINAKRLAQMKPGAILINTARGNLVDEKALVAALESGHVWGAGLDVFEQEPLPTDSPLFNLHNVALAPHMGGLDNESLEAMATLAARCVANLYQGHWPEGCIVNDSLREGWRW